MSNDKMREEFEAALERGDFDMKATWEENCITMMDAFHETRGDLISEFYRAEYWKMSAIGGWFALFVMAFYWVYKI